MINLLVFATIIIHVCYVMLLYFKGYFWDSIFNTENFGAITRWLFLPHVGSDILNKYLLYGMYMYVSSVHVCICILLYS